MHDARRLRLEVLIVLGLSLGASAVYSIVSIVARVTDERPLAEQSAALNPSRSTREWLDFTYQFLDVFFGLFVVALALYLLAQPGANPFRRIGLDLSRPGRDAASGLALVALIGVPGIALYAVGRLAGWTVTVVPSPLDTHWWTVPILVLAALKAALTEEVIVVGYLFTRLRELGLGP
jgi:membrane protease YdiL (CAAX protease family)